MKEGPLYKDNVLFKEWIEKMEFMNLKKIEQ
jgi:hypothetical protein